MSFGIATLGFSVTVCGQLESPAIPKRLGEMVGFVLLRKINTLFLFIKTVKNRTYVVKVPQFLLY